MNSGFTLAILSLIGIVVSVVGGYYIAKGKTSGSIDTTEAETLWQQSNFLLERYKADLESTRTEVSTLKAEVVALRTLIRNLESKAVAVARNATTSALSVGDLGPGGFQVGLVPLQ